MKFSFLKSLFSKTNNTNGVKQTNLSINQTVDTITVPDEEVRDVFHAAIDEVLDESEVDHIDIKDQLMELGVEVAPKQKVTRLVKTNFEIVGEINGNTFSTDKTNGISRVTWEGSVNIEAAEKILTLGADSVEFDGFKKILLDRSQLQEFDTEARMWIKNLLKTRAKGLSKLVEKIAIIKATTAKGSIFSNFIASAIGIILPHLEMRKFDTEKEAIGWLME
ncbi:MAG: hypothetical protein JXR03_02380 [Cyclobacteriaceae bacterium]